ncbi:hypothetical protein WA016_01388 [Myxococcus stipitatus]
MANTPRSVRHRVSSSVMVRLSRAGLLSLCLVAASARAQSSGVRIDFEPITSVSPSGTETSWASEIHLHLEPAAGAFLGAEGPGPRAGFGFALKADFPLLTRRILMVGKLVMWILSLGAIGSDAMLEHTPLSIQVELFGNRFSDTSLLDKGWGWGGGLGARLKLFESAHGESTVRNVWYDLNANLGTNGFGVDTSLGVSLSLSELVSMGPFVKFARVGGVNGLFGGISLDLGAPASRSAPADAASNPATEDAAAKQP